MPRAAFLRPACGPEAPRFVAYYRVSTDKQGRSGLGLEAQREAVSRHVSGAGGRIIAEFEEIESGKRNDRPKIAEALRACRARPKAALAAAKARGIKLGNPNLRQRPGTRALAARATAVRSARAAEHAADVRPYIEAARQAGCRSL